MEPPEMMLEGAEECESSESGWTMYIGSPIEEEARYDDYEEENNDHNIIDYYEHTHQPEPEVESDDSMASDASSRPSHYAIHHPLGNAEAERRGYAGFVEKEYKKDKYFSHKKKATKTKGNQMPEKGVEKNEMLLFNSSKAKAPLHGGGKVKVRKNHWMGTS